MHWFKNTKRMSKCLANKPRTAIMNYIKRSKHVAKFFFKAAEQ